jgi:hypothetical protein
MIVSHTFIPQANLNSSSVSIINKQTFTIIGKDIGAAM